MKNVSTDVVLMLTCSSLLRSSLMLSSLLLLLDTTKPRISLPATVTVSPAWLLFSKYFSLQIKLFFRLWSSDSLLIISGDIEKLFTKYARTISITVGLVFL